jgi:hypothetical protein
MSITAANRVLFMRITNELSEPVMITRLNVKFSEHNQRYPSTERIPTVTEDVFYTLPKGVGIPSVGRTITFPSDNTGTYVLTFRARSADLANAALLELPLLDRLVSGRYINHHESVRGWLFFRSKCFFPLRATVEITDALDRVYSYEVEHSNKEMSGDVMLRTINIFKLVDVSSAHQVLGRP